MKKILAIATMAAVMAGVVLPAAAHDVTEGDISISISIRGGKRVCADDGSSYIGFNSVDRHEHVSPNGNITIRISCTGRGLNECPSAHLALGVYGTALTQTIYDNFMARIHEQIDMGCEGGRIYSETGACCLWSNGSKSPDEETEEYVYNFDAIISTQELSGLIGGE